MKFDFSLYIILGIAMVIIMGIAAKGYIEEWGKQRARQKEKRFIEEDNCKECKEEIMEALKEIKTEMIQGLTDIRNDMKTDMSIVKKAVLAVAVKSKVSIDEYKDLVE
jgi:hypothetical protein